MDTFSAADTLGIINHGNTIFIVCNSVDRTCKLTWSLQMRDCIVRTCSCTSSTLFTFLRINVGTMTSRLNGTEFTCIDTCLSHTVLTVFCNGITGNRAVLTGCTDYLNHVSIILRSRGFALCKTDTLADNFSFFVDTATELWCRARNQTNRDVVSLRIKSTLKCQFCNLTQNGMLDLDYIFISVHKISFAFSWFLLSIICSYCT